MWQATFSRTPLDVWSDRRRSLYQTTQNTHDRQTTRHPARFEPDNPRKLQTHALYRAATGIGKYRLHRVKYNLIISRKLSLILRRVRNPTEHLVQSICLLVIQHIKKRDTDFNKNLILKFVLKHFQEIAINISGSMLCIEVKVTDSRLWHVIK
jgi:hypothetical protein